MPIDLNAPGLEDSGNDGTTSDGSALPPDDGGASHWPDASTAPDALTPSQDASSEASKDSGSEAGLVCPANGVCVPATTRPIACGSFCGSYTETCSATCTWAQTTNCATVGVCVPGEIEESLGACVGGQVMTRTCSGACGFGAYSACGPRHSGWVRIPDHGRGYNRYQATAWTGSEMFIIGGAHPSGAHSTFVGAYDPVAIKWRTPPQLPAGRSLSFAAWSGSEILIWGGIDPFGSATATGHRYSAATNTWTAMSDSPLTARGGASGVWVPATSELVVWGGGDYANGAAYKPATNTWRTTAAAPIGGRSNASAVLVGTSKMVIFGGTSGGAQVGDAAVYDAVTDTWTSIGIAPSWQREYGQGAASSGTTAYFWGGVPPALGARGVQYTPSAWSLMPSPSAALLPKSTYRVFPAALFGAGRLWVWGGIETAGALLENPKTGASFDPATGTWTAMPVAPFSMFGTSGVWSGSELLYWGDRAYDSADITNATGLLYRP